MRPKIIQRSLGSFICRSCHRQLFNAFLARQWQPLSTSGRHLQDEPSNSKTKAGGELQGSGPSLADGLLQAMGPAETQQSNYSSTDTLMAELKTMIKLSNSPQDVHGTDPPLAAHREPHHLHVLATKHNTHVTLTRPNCDAIMSLSAGNLGLRKAQRGTYDAAFQLAAYVLRSMQERGLLRRGYDSNRAEVIDGLEVVFRGFGPGREAVSKALLGNEGRNVRDRIVRVSDGTRLKFGGTRSPNPRRLG